MSFQDEKYLKYDRLLCINLDNTNYDKIPNSIKEYIYNGLKEQEKVLIFTDYISYQDVERSFPTICQYINSSFAKGNLQIKMYNSIKFREDSSKIINTLDVLSKSKSNIRIIWDFKNVIKKPGELAYIIEFIECIFSKFNNKNAKNLIYINNYVYDLKLFQKLCDKFKALIIFNKDKQIIVKSKNEIKKNIWLLQNNAQLKFQNNNLVLFNDEFSTIPKEADEEKFKTNIINKLIELCDVDFCILYSSLNMGENLLALDNYYNITKTHKYYIMNDSRFMDWINDVNNNILENKTNRMFLNINALEDNWLLKINKEIGIKSTVNVYVEYYQNVKGIICLGKYGNGNISESNIEYIESLCKAAFFLIQEQKNFLNIQNKLIENEKLRAMGEMAAGIAHDINNVLTPIIGSVQMLKEKIQDRDVLKKLELIELCANDGMQITNKVKKITRNYNNKQDWEVFSIDKLIIDAIDLTKDKWMRQSAVNGIQISVMHNLKSSSMIRGNITEIREVFINIISNAVDAMPFGGKIEITSENIKGNVEIEIRDNGLGMNKEIVKRVFEPFFTTKGSNGCGLGLSISYKIIQSHFGNIKIESEENVGTSFKIKLPICKEKIYTVKEDKDEVILEDDLDISANVLVIDDQEIIRKVISEMIKSISNCKVKTCSGEDIDREFKRRNYDIILCDFSMPNINGIQIAKKAAEMQENAYFCLMTGWVGSFDNDKIDYIDFVLNKPINNEELKKLFYNYINKNNN